MLETPTCRAGIGIGDWFVLTDLDIGVGIFAIHCAVVGIGVLRAQVLVSAEEHPSHCAVRKMSSSPCVQCHGLLRAVQGSHRDSRFDHTDQAFDRAAIWLNPWPVGPPPRSGIWSRRAEVTDWRASRSGRCAARSARSCRHDCGWERAQHSSPRSNGSAGPASTRPPVYRIVPSVLQRPDGRLAAACRP